MICFVRASTIDYDIRLNKYTQICRHFGVKYFALTWNRLKESNAKKGKDEIQYKRFAPYGRRYKNYISLIGWSLFVLYNLFKERNRYKVIHACNIESVILAYPFKLLKKRIIFDIYDSSKFIKIERYFSKHVDLLILPSRNRLKQLNLKEKDVKGFLEVENVPILSKYNVTVKSVDFPHKIHLSYVGVLQPSIRGIENIINVVMDNPLYELDIAGVGGSMEQMIEDAAKECGRIHYYGKVDYEKAIDIMNQSDFIVALYYLNCPVHKYASPNKFYESLFLNKPIITSNGTLVGERVINSNTGYVIDDSREAIENIFCNVNEKDFLENYNIKVINCQKLWVTKYNDYVDKVGLNYISTINNIDAS